jgi:hypothetical protein
VTLMANHALLATVLATSQVLYVANTTTFGCSSIQEIAKLQLIRTVTKAFQAELYEQILGKVVAGSYEPGDSSMLLVDRRIEPPGFVAPLHDFHKLKEPSGGK